MSRTHRPTAHRTRPGLVAVVGVALVTVVVGCGKGSISDRPTTTTTKPLSTAEATEVYVDAIVPLIRQVAGVSPKDEAASECLARSWVSTIGVQTLIDEKIPADRLEEKFDDLDLTQEQADAMAKAFTPCKLDLASLVATRIGDTVGATPEEQACIDAALTPERVEQSVASALMGDTGQTEAQAALEACGSGG